MSKQKEQRITVKELMTLLSAYPPDKELYFGGLEFYRLKDRGAHVQVEFSESIDTDSEGNVVILTQRM